MTKIVEGIGDAIGSVIKGVVDVVSGVVKGVGDLAKSIADSDIGKAILVAGAVYFGGAALAGGFGSSAAGGSFLSGMGTGVATAAETLSGAWSSTLAGNFGEAASAIGNTFGAAGTAAGESATLASQIAAPAASALTTASQIPAAASTGTGLTAGAGTSTGLTSGGMSATGATGTLGSASPYAFAQPGAASTLASTLPAAAPAAGFLAGVDPYLKTAAIMGGTQVVGGLISGAGQAKAAQEQRDFEVDQAELARERRNKNMGAPLDFTAVRASAAERAAANPQTGTPWDPQAAARALIAQYYPQALQPTGGVISRYMPGGGA